MSVGRDLLELLVGHTILVVAAGLAALILMALVVEKGVAIAVARRLLWRVVVVAAALWLVTEIVGGNQFLAQYFENFRSPAVEKARSASLLASKSTVPRTWRFSSSSESPLMQPESRLQTLRAPIVDVRPSVEFLPANPPPASSRRLSTLHWEPANASESDSRPTLPALEQSVPTQMHRVPVAIPAHAADELEVPVIAHAPWGGIALVWVSGAICVALWMAIGRAMIAWFTWRHTSPASAAIEWEIEQVKRELEYPANERAQMQPCQPLTEADCKAGRRPWRCLRILHSSRLPTPVVYGIWRPKLVIPSGFSETLPANCRAAVLAHELTHVAARDPQWQLAYDVIAALLWWHPLVWMARVRHRAACEAAADAGAAAIPGGTRALAGGLVKLARNMVAGPRLGWAVLDLGRRRRSRLGRRVIQLLSESAEVAGPISPSFHRGRGTVASITLFALLLLCTALARPAVSVPDDVIGGNEMRIWQSSWHSSIAAAALAAMVGSAPAAQADEKDVETEPQIARVELEFVGDEADEKSGAHVPLELAVEVEPLIEFVLNDGDSDKADKSSERQPAVREKPRAVLHFEAKEKQQAALAAEKVAQAQAQLAMDGKKFAEELEHQIRVALEQVKRDEANGRLASAEAMMDRVRALEKLRAAASSSSLAGQPEMTIRKYELAMEKQKDVGKLHEAESRVHHLLQAAQNLKAVGKHELAEQLAKEAQQIIAQDVHRTKAELDESELVRRPLGESFQLELRNRVPQAEAVELKIRRAAESREKEAAVAHREQSVDELRKEMQELREQVRDMQALLKRVVVRLEERDSQPPLK